MNATRDGGAPRPADPRHWRRGVSLIRHEPFEWGRNARGALIVRTVPEGEAVATFTAAQQRTMLDLLTDSRDGIPVGVAVHGRVQADPLGRLLSGFGMSRTCGAWFAAIAVAEGHVDAEHRHEGGVRLLRASGARRPFDGLSPGIGAGVPGSPSDEAASRLRALADAVERTGPEEVATWRFALSVSGRSGDDRALLRDIEDREQETPGATWLYRLDVDSPRSAALCRTAFAGVRDRNVRNLTFARANRVGETATCLYTGASGMLGERVRQHLGLAHRGVPALHLRRWRWPADDESDATGTVLLQASRLSSDIDEEVVQALAEAAWLRQRPLFGAFGCR